MAEDFGLVRYKSIPASTAQNALDAVYACIIDTTSPDHYWQVLTGSTYTPGSSTELYLMAVPQGHGGDSDNQRIGVRVSSGMLQIAYDPSGALAPSTVPTDAGVWTGWRSITQSTAGIGTAITHVYVVEYRDSGDLPAANLPGRNYASSLAILLAVETGNKHFPWAANVGRIIRLDNEEDEDLGYLGSSTSLRGDALLLGIPQNYRGISFGGDLGSWFRTYDGADANNCGIIRTWDNIWYTLAITEEVRDRSYGSATNNDNPNGPLFNCLTMATADMGGTGRPDAFRLMVPFNVFGGVKRRPVNSYVIDYAGVMGQTKYVRQTRQALTFAQSYQSTDPASQQAWKPLVYNSTTTSQAHVILWNKTPIQVL